MLALARTQSDSFSMAIRFGSFSKGMTEGREGEVAAVRECETAAGLVGSVVPGKV